MKLEYYVLSAEQETIPARNTTDAHAQWITRCLYPSWELGRSAFAHYKEYFDIVSLRVVAELSVAPTNGNPVATPLFYSLRSPAPRQARPNPAGIISCSVVCTVQQVF